ncbi:MAG: serine hydrolase domain-containing protein [Marmoricola sp.]
MHLNGDDSARLQAVLDRAQRRGRLPSVVGAVVQDGRVELAACSGAHGAVDAQYRIGSITKTMTAVLVMQCRRDGLLDLDDRLGTHLPEAGYADATLRDLLAHTAGLQAEPVGPWWERSPGVDVATLLARNDGSGRVFAAREAFHYSNLGFALLGEVVARLRGRAWSDLVTERLTVPLGMTRTGCVPVAPYAQGYSVDHFAGTLTAEPHHDTGAMAPAGQVWSTVADLALWLDFLATGHDDVLDADTISAMAVPGAPGLDYGLGLRLIGPMVGHTGSMPGFLAAAFVDRATRRGAVALSNATTGLATDEIAAELLTGAADPGPTWTPSDGVPAGVSELLGLWFWGNTAHELRWSDERLELRVLGDPDDADVFAPTSDGWRGTEGYLMGERLEVARRPDGSVDRLDCATFRFTRTPYPDGA